MSKEISEKVSPTANLSWKTVVRSARTKLTPSCLAGQFTDVAEGEGHSDSTTEFLADVDQPRG